MRRMRLLAGWTTVDSLLAAAIVAVVLANLLTGSAFIAAGTGGGHQAPSTEPPNHIGLASAVIRVRIEDANCCYMEGAVRVVHLEGPTSAAWAVRDRSEARVATGAYTLTAFEQVCSGSCAMLEPPTNHCEIELDLASGDAVDILVTFPIPAPCTMEVGDAKGGTTYSSGGADQVGIAEARADSNSKNWPIRLSVPSSS